MLQQACYALVDGFTDLSGPESKRREMYVSLTASIIAFIVALIIVAFFGKMLWNGVIIELFTVAKPVRSVWQIVGLMVFLALIR